MTFLGVDFVCAKLLTNVMSYHVADFGPLSRAFWKNLQHDSPNMRGGGVKGHLEFFRKFICFGDATSPLLNMMLRAQNSIPGKKYGWKSKKKWSSSYLFGLIKSLLVFLPLRGSQNIWGSVWPPFTYQVSKCEKYIKWQPAEKCEIRTSQDLWLTSNVSLFLLSPVMEGCLSPPKSIGVGGGEGGCLLLLLPLPNPKTSILPKVLADVCYWWVRTNNRSPSFVKSLTRTPRGSS